MSLESRRFSSAQCLSCVVSTCTRVYRFVVCVCVCLFCVHDEYDCELIIYEMLNMCFLIVVARYFSDLTQVCVSIGAVLFLVSGLHLSGCCSQHGAVFVVHHSLLTNTFGMLCGRCFASTRFFLLSQVSRVLLQRSGGCCGCCSRKMDNQ